MSFEYVDESVVAEMGRSQKKMLDDIESLCRSDLSGSKIDRAHAYLYKMKWFEDFAEDERISLELMDKFIASMRAKYAIGTVVISMQFTGHDEPVCCVTYAKPENSMNRFYTLQGSSIYEGYVKASLDLFRRIKLGQYSKRK